VHHYQEVCEVETPSMHQLTRPFSNHDHEGEEMRAESADRVFRSYETVAKEVDQDLEVVEGKIPRI
jgi:hypothetical protein